MPDLFKGDRRTAREEAAHAVCARRLGLEVNHLSIVGDKSSRGRASIKPNGDGPALVVVQVIGKLVVGEEEWPPLWVDAVNEEREGLAELLRLCRIGVAAYESLVDVARSMAKDTAFQREVDLVAEALFHYGYVSGPHLDMLLGGLQ